MTLARGTIAARGTQPHKEKAMKPTGHTSKEPKPTCYEPVPPEPFYEKKNEGQTEEGTKAAV